MTTYIIFYKDRSDGRLNELNSNELIACKIASRVMMDFSRHETFNDFYDAINQDSNLAKLSIHKKSAVCSVEIDEKNIKIWNDEVLSVLEKEKKIHDTIGDTWDLLNELADDLYRKCKNSSNLKKMVFHEDFSVDPAFDFLSRSARVDISHDLKRIFRVKIFANN